MSGLGQEVTFWRPPEKTVQVIRKDIFTRISNVNSAQTRQCFIDLCRVHHILSLEG
jgi:nucleoside phosphorylase